MKMTVLEEYKKAKQEALNLLKEIENKITLLDKVDGQEIHWGYVCTIKHAKCELEDINNFLG